MPNKTNRTAIPMSSGARQGGAKPVAGNEPTLRRVALADTTEAPVEFTVLLMMKGTGVPIRTRVTTVTFID